MLWKRKGNGRELSVRRRLVYEVTFKLKLKGVSLAKWGGKESTEVEAGLDGKGEPSSSPRSGRLGELCR